MRRIKLPGNEKNKKILLIVLIIVGIGILSYEAWTNMNSKNIKTENKSEILKPINEEESYINDTTNKDVKEDSSNNSKIKKDYEKIKINEEEKSYSARETELYNEAYRLFFSYEYENAIKEADVLISEFPNNAMGII